MKRNISHLLYIVAIGFFTSCSDFLDVAPKDKVLEEDQYKTEAGIHGAFKRALQAINIYLPLRGEFISDCSGRNGALLYLSSVTTVGEINCLPHCFSSVTDGPKSMEQLKAYLPIYGKADIIRFSISTIF